ncbi:MAG: ribose 5-phosphate isomerase A [Thermoplasmata archaeon]|nr:MAG: ribose 5-phosphate isomerase A [Thermoplasmata archaeon]
METKEMKRIAAQKAVEYIEDDMIVGLGTGSTVKYALEYLSKRIQEGLSIKAIPTSIETKRIAQKEQINIVSLLEYPEIDITIDGADEVDSNLNLIKGGGGALAREKIIAYHSKKVIIIADDSKVVKMLGINFPLPVEVLKFEWESTKRALETFGCDAKIRKIFDDPFITDNGNYIVDCEFEKINDPEQLEIDINMIPGVVENGLFIGLATEVIVGSKQGIITLEKEIIPTQ